MFIHRGIQSCHTFSTQSVVQGTYYYNRRLPKHAVKACGPFIRQSLSKCPEEAAAYSKRLSDVLEGSWSGTTGIISPVNISYIVSSF